MSATSSWRVVHLAENRLLPADAACPLCGYRGLRRAVIRLQDDPRVDLLDCRCGCRSASRMPREEVLREYYTNCRRVSGGLFPTDFEGSDRLARHLLRLLDLEPVAPDATLRILDFGGGPDAAVARSLARRAIERGVRQVEVALVDYRAGCQRDWGAITVECHQHLGDVRGELDAIVASAVVEHIPHPHETLVALLKLLRPGGRVYFRTPSMSPLIALSSRFGGRLEFTYPAHVHDMGQAFWENLLPSLGLNGGYRLIRSRPAIIEADFRLHPARAAIAGLFKLPWLLLRSRYRLVGGWEAVIAREPARSSADRSQRPRSAAAS